MTRDEFSCIPEPLRRINRWVVRRGKVPQAVRETGGGRLRAFPGSAHDPENWLSAMRAATLANAAERELGDSWGIGFDPVEEDDIGFVDLDGCRDPETGNIASWARYICDRGFRGAYCEASTSGTGLKLLVRGAFMPRARQHAVIPAASDLRIEERDPFAEMYAAHQFTCVTGKHLTGIMAYLVDCSWGWRWLEGLMAGPDTKPRKTAQAMMADADLAEVQSALMSFTSDDVDRSEFAGYASVLKDAFGEGGWPVFAAWMARSPMDDPAATRRLWDGAKAARRMTVASIFWRARQNGWEPPHRSLRNDEIVDPYAGAGVVDMSKLYETTEAIND